MTPINFALPGFFKKAGAGASEFNEDMPPITDELSIYLDPDYGVFSDEGNSLAVDGDNIRQMWDRSATGNTLNQTTAAQQPLYDTTTFGNGNASIYALNDFLGTTTDLSVGVNDNYTMYMVYKKSANSNIYYSIRGSAGYPRFEHLTTKIQFRDNQGSGASWTYTDNTDLKIIALTLDRSAGTHGEHKLYVNGAYTALRDYTINWDVDITKIFANGTAVMNYGRLLWYDGEHSADQVLQVSEWLGDKYDLLVAPVTENLALYFNPEKEVYSDAGTTLATDGDYIREWDDRSTNDNDLDQPTASSQLKYKTSLLNSKNGVEATSNTDMLLSNTISLQGCTIYAVNKKDNTSAEMMPAGGSGNVTIGNNYSDGNTYLYDGTNVATLSVGHFTDWAVRAYVWDYGTDFEVFENNSSLGSVSATNVGSITIDRLFGRGNGSAGTKNCMEILVFTDTHDATQIEEMTDWLVDKYGILPVTTNLEHHFSALASEGVYSDGGTTTITDGGLVQQIDDMSGNNNNLTQTTTANKIKWLADYDNSGYPAFVKKNTEQQNAFLSLDSNISITQSEDVTLYVVCKKGSSNSMTFYGGPSGTGFHSWPNTFYAITDTWSLKSTSTTTWSDPNFNTLQVRAFVKDKTTNNKIYVYEDGSLIHTITGTPSGTMTFNRFFNRGGLDADSVGTYDVWQESALYRDAHDATQVAQVSNYMKTKWGI